MITGPNGAVPPMRRTGVPTSRPALNASSCESLTSHSNSVLAAAAASEPGSPARKPRSSRPEREGSDLPAVAQRQLGEGPAEELGPAKNQPHAANDAFPAKVNRAGDVLGVGGSDRELRPVSVFPELLSKRHRPDRSQVGQRGDEAGALTLP